MEEHKKIDWSSFTVHIPLENPETEIKDLWFTQENLERWFLRLAEFRTVNGALRSRAERIEPGDTYRWQWHGWPDSVEDQGVLLNPEKGEFLRFVFAKAGIVGLRIIEQKDLRVLQLVQEDIPVDEKSRMNYHVGCKTGWTFYLLNLKSILKGGPDLRNKNSELQMD